MKDIPILNVYYLLCYAWGFIQEQTVSKLESLKELTHTKDLLGKLLSSGVNHLVRRGLERGYIFSEEEYVGIRGKLKLSETIKRSIQIHGRTVCEYDELSADVLPNQILRATLKLLVDGDSNLDGRIKKDVHWALLRLRDVSDIRLIGNTFSHIQISGNSRLYRFLIAICQMLYENSLVDEDAGSTPFYDFRQNDIQMWRLFERFVIEFFKREQQEFAIKGQTEIEWGQKASKDEASNALIPSMFADVILESEERRIILDTKYYRHAVTRGSDQYARKLHSVNLYQLLAYLRNRQATNPHGPKHEGILLYPEVDSPLRADVELEGFRIQARTLNLNQAWQEIHQEMLETIKL